MPCDARARHACRRRTRQGRRRAEDPRAVVDASLPVPRAAGCPTRSARASPLAPRHAETHERTALPERSRGATAPRGFCPQDACRYPRFADWANRLAVSRSCLAAGSGQVANARAGSARDARTAYIVGHTACRLVTLWHFCNDLRKKCRRMATGRRMRLQRNPLRPLWARGVR